MSLEKVAKSLGIVIPRFVGYEGCEQGFSEAVTSCFSAKGVLASAGETAAFKLQLHREGKETRYMFYSRTVCLYHMDGDNRIVTIYDGVKKNILLTHPHIVSEIHRKGKSVDLSIWEHDVEYMLQHGHRIKNPRNRTVANERIAGDEDIVTMLGSQGAVAWQEYCAMASGAHPYIRGSTDVNFEKLFFEDPSKKNRVRVYMLGVNNGLSANATCSYSFCRSVAVSRRTCNKRV